MRIGNGIVDFGCVHAGQLFHTVNGIQRPCRMRQHRQPAAAVDLIQNGLRPLLHGRLRGLRAAQRQDVVHPSGTVNAGGIVFAAAEDAQPTDAAAFMVLAVVGDGHHIIAGSPINRRCLLRRAMAVGIGRVQMQIDLHALPAVHICIHWSTTLFFL